LEREGKKGREKKIIKQENNNNREAQEKWEGERDS